MRLSAGQQAPEFVVDDMHQRPISLVAYCERRRPVLLMFYRSAVCPLCSINLLELIERFPEYHALGLEVIAFFESSAKVVRRFHGRLRCPFPIIPDREKAAYSLYQLETSVIGTARGSMLRDRYREAKRRNAGIVPLIPGFIAMDGAKFRMPAGFLIDPDQTIRIAYYGRTSGDFLPFADIEAALVSLSHDALPQSENGDH
ncbi:MAG TPA: peroxiredoxin-like family protein [Ktedonobacterales bacterium]